MASSEKHASFEDEEVAGVEQGVVAVHSKHVSDGDHTDIALALYKESLSMDPSERDRIAKTVLRKLDFVVLPMVNQPSPFASRSSV